MNKKLISSVTAAALILGMSASAADIKVKCDYQSKKINVTLDTQSDYNKNILFYLVDASVTDINNITSANIATSIFDVKEVSGNNGVYNVSLDFPDVKGKQYKVLYENYNANEDVGGTAMNARLIAKYIASDSDVSTCLSALNGANATTILNELNTYKEWLGLPVDSSYTFASTTPEDVTMGILLTANKPAGGFTSFNEVYTAFENARAAAALKNATADTLEDALTKYGEVFGIELNDDYNAYTGEEDAKVYTFKNLINTAVVNGYALLNNNATLYQDLKRVFDEQTALTVLNNSTRDKIDGVLSKYNNIFNLNLTNATYQALNSDGKINFNKALERKNFNTIIQVISAFNARLQDYANSNANSSSSNYSGGGGGGGGNNYSAGSKSTITYSPNGENTNTPSSDIPVAETEKFSDLAGSEWAKEAVYALVDKNVIAGYDDGTFRPNNNITRNEFITMLILAFDKLDENAEYTFTDGDKDAWYAKYIASAKQAGILSGYSDGRFGDGENITREDMAVFVHRLAGYEKADAQNTFADDFDISDYAKEAVYTLNSKGIINGIGDNKFAPKAFATRAQAARILYSALGGADNE